MWLATSGPQASAVGFDDRAADYQSHSHDRDLDRLVCVGRFNRAEPFVLLANEH